MVTYPSDWKITSIDKLGKCYSGLSGKSADDFGTGSAYYITFLNVLKNIKVDMDALEKVSVSSGENQNAVKKGDLFFNTSSETPDEVGMCAVLLSDLNNVYLNSFCFGFRLYNTSVLSPLFASYFFNSIYGRRLMSLYAQGSTRYNLSKSSFIKMEIPVPSIKEQQAIASVISDFDEHIDNLTELIEKKKAIRDGALEDLVSGRTRLDGFNGEWKEEPLQKICDIYDGTHQTPKYTASGIKFVSVENISDIYSSDKYISLADYTRDFKVRPEQGDVLMTRIGDIGTSCIVGTKEPIAYYVSLALFKEISIDSEFLNHYIESKDFKKELDDRTLHHATPKKINKGEIGKCKVRYPENKVEQKAIASILTAMDEEIQFLKIEKAKMIEIKEGAMDDLLTGRVRLKV